MHEYYAQENGKIYYAITSRDAMENDATQISEVSKYQIISQFKLDQGIFQDLEHGGVSTNPWRSLPFPSHLLFPFPLPPLPLSPSFPPEAGGCCAKIGGVLTPLRGVWETP